MRKACNWPGQWRRCRARRPKLTEAGKALGDLVETWRTTSSDRRVGWGGAVGRFGSGGCVWVHAGRLSSQDAYLQMHVPAGLGQKKLRH